MHVTAAVLRSGVTYATKEKVAHVWCQQSKIAAQSTPALAPRCCFCGLKPRLLRLACIVACPVSDETMDTLTIMILSVAAPIGCVQQEIVHRLPKYPSSVIMPLTCTKANLQKTLQKAAAQRRGHDCSRFRGFSTLMTHQEQLIDMQKKVFLRHSLSRIGLRGLLFGGTDDAKLVPRLQKLSCSH